MEVTQAGSLGNRILAMQDVKSEIVEIPQWEGVKLEVRSMTGLERADMLERYMDNDGNMNIRDLYPSMIIACTFDPETGEPVFSGEQADALNAKNAAALEKVAQVAMRLSGMNEVAQEAMGKDSSEGASDGSTST